MFVYRESAKPALLFLIETQMSSPVDTSYLFSPIYIFDLFIYTLRRILHQTAINPSYIRIYTDLTTEKSHHADDIK